MSGSLQAWYSLRDLESSSGREVVLSGEVPLANLKRLSGLLHSDAGSVRASLRFRQRRGGWLALELTYDTSVQLQCQRCLEPFRHDVAERVELALADSESLPAAAPQGQEPLEIEEGRLSPAELIEDELILAMPLVPKHERIEDCGSLARNLAGLTDEPEAGAAER
jgi:uncharacterized protein